jgi:hypothetical protein
MDLLSGEIESALARLGARKIDFYVHLVRTKTVDEAGRATNADLRGRNVFGIDLEVVGNVVELNGDRDSDFSHGITGDSEPQGNGKE